MGATLLPRCVYVDLEFQSVFDYSVLFFADNSASVYNFLYYIVYGPQKSYMIMILSSLHLFPNMHEYGISVHVLCTLVGHCCVSLTIF